MIKITKEQAIALSKCGFKWGEHLMHTTGHHHTYYCCENPKVLAALARLQANEIK